MILPRPCPPAEAVQRALALVAAEARLATPHRYGLGAGNYYPDRPDSPLSRHAADGTLRCDCSGFVGWCCRLPRRRPGFNRGSWSVVTDWVNTDSKIQDASHHRELFELAVVPHLGDVLCWPSIYAGELERDPARRGKRVRIGHESVVVGVDRVAEWDCATPSFSLLDVAQCGSSHTPAIHVSTGAAWAGRDRFRGERRPEWGAVLLRPIA